MVVAAFLCVRGRAAPTAVQRGWRLVKEGCCRCHDRLRSRFVFDIVALIELAFKCEC